MSRQQVCPACGAQVRPASPEQIARGVTQADYQPGELVILNAHLEALSTPALCSLAVRVSHTIGPGRVGVLLEALAIRLEASQ